MKRLYLTCKTILYPTLSTCLIQSLSHAGLLDDETDKISAFLYDKATILILGAAALYSGGVALITGNLNKAMGQGAIIILVAIFIAAIKSKQIFKLFG